MSRVTTFTSGIFGSRNFKNRMLSTAASVLFIGSALGMNISASAQSFFSPSKSSLSTQAMTVDNRGILTMAPLLENVTPAVVSIEVSGNSKPSGMSDEQSKLLERFFGGRMPQQQQERKRQGIGSGVIVDAGDGLIITNHHVIDGAEEIFATLEDGRSIEAELVGSDEKTDIAVLKIKAKGLKSLALAKSNDSKVGDYVIAVGNPFGLSSTVTSGIISAMGRDTARGGNYADFIQTDASINPGNSGGALVNSKGELIGINTAILSRSGGNNGIGFAVPVKMVRGVMKQLVEYGEVKRGRIGISIRNIDLDLQEAMNLSTRKGALVNEVVEKSAAAKAGLEAGDIVVRFNNEDILDASDIRNAVGLVEPGTRTDIAYLRDGRRISTKITVEEVDEEMTVLNDTTIDELPAMESFSGAELTAIPEDLNPRGGDAGVYVSKVESGSKANRAGLRKGDIIRKINRSTVKDLKSFEAAIDGKSGPFALSVEREGSNIFLAVR